MPSDSYLQVYHGQLGEISVGFGEQAGKTNEQYYDSYYQNLKNNDDISIMGRSQQGNTSPYIDPFKNQRAEEDTYIKANLEYE